MSAAVAIQQAIFTKLDGTSGVTTLLAAHAFAAGKKAIYDRTPQAAAPEDNSAFPYIVIGDDTAAEWDTDDSAGQETKITLHVWSRYRGKRETKQILDALYAALHNATLTVTGHLALYCYWEFHESLEDPDGVTQHGVTRYRIVTQQN